MATANPREAHGYRGGIGLNSSLTSMSELCLTPAIIFPASTAHQPQSPHDQPMPSTPERTSDATR
jgi:hypothetical protein